MNKVILMGLIMSIFFINMISAADIGTAKQGDTMDLYQMCSNCTYVNVTSVTYPNKSVIDIGAIMTKSGEDYTYAFTDTWNLGGYKYNVCGDKDGEVKCEVHNFNVTPSGFVGTLGFYVLILCLSFGVMILGFSLKDAPIVILGSFGLYFVGLYILFYGIDSLKDPVYTWALGLIILMLASYISIKSSYELIVD